MKTGMRWMALAVVALVSTSAWAIWDPDADGNLKFNMNFEVYNNTTHTTTDAKALLVGTLTDFNIADANVFGGISRAGLSYDANFAEIHDFNIGAGVESDVCTPNDVRLKMQTGAATSIFDLGWVANKHTWTFWFNVPNLGGTILRHAYKNLQEEGYEDNVWEIRIYGGKLQFYHKNNSLRFETASTLSDLGVTVNTWHHAAVVIDRTDSRETAVPTTQLSTKIYIDGLEVPIIVSFYSTENMNVDVWRNSPLWIGAGAREFDGMLDDVRLFDDVLTPLEVSILNQPDNTVPRALSPIPGSSNVLRTTDVSWEPATGGVTAQKVYFGTDPCNLPLKKTIDGSPSPTTVSNGDLGGPLPFNTKYYWYVKSYIGAVDSNGPLWSFTVETGKALNPSPADGEEDVNTIGADLSWSTITPATYTVYLSTDRSLVDANDINVRITEFNSVPHVNDVNTSSRGSTYYWRVDCIYGLVGIIRGDTWSFRTKSYELVFNTSGLVITYADHAIPAYTCMQHSDGWSTVKTGYFDSNCGMAVFDFSGGFDYDSRYDIIVVPEYRATDVNSTIFPTPLAIHVTGDFSFDGRVQIAGDDILETSQVVTFARSGGYGGPKNNQEVSVFHNRTVTITDYWDTPTMPAANHGRFGNISSAKQIFIPKALAKSVFGPGQPVNPPYKGGGGGGSGGVGGDSGRGYYFGIFSGGPSYGDEEVPVPFGGSSGGWGGGDSPGGAAGGGGIEIVATGNVVIDSNSQIIANGGGQLCSGSGYPAGGGGGGSVKIIAGGSVTNKGTINVNGGKGGNGSSQGNNTGGGGGGGRVAIFYGSNYDFNDGVITADGGAKGTYGGTGLARDGEDGTIFVTNGSPRKASAPTPNDGNEMVYCNPSPCTIKLKWYSGYGGVNDVVYFGTNPNPTDPCGPVPAKRGQHDVNMTVSSGNTYYWKVVTDGNVSSDIWYFRTVSWQCPFAISGAAPHVGGPEWDWNHDCVLTLEDFAYFVEDWVNSEFGTYILDNPDFNRFAGEWFKCYNRTDGGCTGW